MYPKEREDSDGKWKSGFCRNNSDDSPSVGFQGPKAFDGKEGLLKIKMEQRCRAILNSGIKSRFEC
jgi:hypothetical protein